MVTVERFSGGKGGIAPGSCGLFTAFGAVNLKAALQAAACLQHRATFGAGVTLKNVYAGEKGVYVVHIMYRDEGLAVAVEGELRQEHFYFFGEPEALVEAKWYQKYDMPTLKRYRVMLPPEDEMLRSEHTSDPDDFLLRKVTHFNLKYRDNARIFSSGKDTGTFITAFTLEDTAKIYDLEQYDEGQLRAAQFHVRWPTAYSSGGLWWGAQPIAMVDVSGTHNGHLSSEASNRFALEQLGIELHVGTDSEAIFHAVRYLLRQGYTAEEMEWVLARKFPQEVEMLPPEERQRYLEVTRDPILTRLKMSGPSTAIVLVGEKLIGITDRDHLRQFALGVADGTVFASSEEAPVLTAAYLMGKEVNLSTPEAGRLVCYELADGAVREVKG